MRVSIRIITIDNEDKLMLSVGNSFRLVDLCQIHHLQSDGSYTEIYLLDGTTLVDTRPMCAYEQLLKQYHFYRVNKSMIINLNKVESYNHAKKTIKLKSGQQVEVARRRCRDFVEAVHKRTTLILPVSSVK